MMDATSIVELLEGLEWSGSAEVYLEDTDPDPGAHLPACPRCKGLKECPETVAVGDKFSGYLELNVHEDTKDDVGHRQGCALASALHTARDADSNTRLRENLTRAFCALTEMWSRRYDTPSDDIPDTEGSEPFGAPVAVDLGRLAEAQSSLLTAVSILLPDLYEKMHKGGVPDAPLPDASNKIVSLDAHRIRTEEEFQDEQVAYMEALWGKETFAFNLAVRDLEKMRRGEDNKSLRPPETYHEMQHMILHVRALANDLARLAHMDNLVRVEDDLHNHGEKADGEEPVD